MRKILFLSAMFIATFSSCQKQDELEKVDNDGESQLEMERKAAQMRSHTFSTKIYRYYTYIPNNSDHYFGTEAPNGNSLVVNGKTYSAAGQEFYVSSVFREGSRVLYRHYNPISNDHYMCNCKVENGYINSTLLGYTFDQQQPGTVPLYQYYQPDHKNHFYVCRESEVEWVRQNEPKAIQNGIIGYVYPGDRHDPLKKAHSITINYQNIGWSLNTELYVYYMDNGQTKTATYNETNWSGGSRTYTLPSTAMLLAATFKYSSTHNGNLYYYFDGITMPNFNQVQGTARLNIKQLNGYNTIYELKPR